MGSRVTSIYDMASTVRFGYVFVAKNKDKIVGAIIGSKTSKNECYIEDFLVDKKYQGQGIGTKIYKKLFSEVGTLPIIAFVSPKYKTSLHIHKNLGFKILKKIKDPYAQGKNEYRYLLRKT